MEKHLNYPSWMAIFWQCYGPIFAFEWAIILASVPYMSHCWWIQNKRSLIYNSAWSRFCSLAVFHTHTHPHTENTLFLGLIIRFGALFAGKFSNATTFQWNCNSVCGFLHVCMCVHSQYRIVPSSSPCINRFAPSNY